MHQCSTALAVHGCTALQMICNCYPPALNSQGTQNPRPSKPRMSANALIHQVMYTKPPITPPAQMATEINTPLHDIPPRCPKRSCAQVLACLLTSIMQGQLLAPDLPPSSSAAHTHMLHIPRLITCKLNYQPDSCVPAPAALTPVLLLPLRACTAIETARCTSRISV